jgi:hypothetical protein
MNTQKSISKELAHAIAVESYIYLYPLVTMEVTRLQGTNVEAPAGFFAPMNMFSHARKYPDASFKAVVRPNFDTLYSTAWVDATQEPIIFSVPSIYERYFVLPMYDMWTDCFAAPGSRATGGDAGHFAWVTPGWKGSLPDGVTRIDAPTPYGWIIGRTQTNGPEDYDDINKFQDAMKATPLSQWGKERVQTKTKVDPTIDMKTSPMEQVNNMTAKQFFEYAAKLMKLNPPHITDFIQVARINRIGIKAGADLDFASLDPVVQKAMNQAVTDALKIIKGSIGRLTPIVNGWVCDTGIMGVYGNFYLKRASVALAGLGALPPEVAIYPMLVSDAEGNKPTGDKNYILHFEKDDIPPVDAFWSITMYDIDGFGVPNKLNRQALSSWMPLKYNADGSLDLYIQAESPGSDRETNWLPSPKSGLIGPTLRLYDPRQQVLDNSWSPPPLKRI